MLNKKIIDYKNYGKCLCLSNDHLEMIITADVGPRIIGLSLPGGDNLLFEDIDRKISDKSARMTDYYGAGAVWYLYGGHRLWSSPEIIPATSYPDNFPVYFDVNGNNAVLRQRPQTENGITIELELTFSASSPEVSILHRITNTSKNEKTLSAWAITAMAAGGVAVLPYNRENTGFLPNRVISLWPYTDPSDPRIQFSRDFISVRHDATFDTNLKLGTNNTSGTVAYLNHGVALVKQYKALHGTAEYPDFGVSTEIYSSPLFTEIETLSPVRVLAPGETAELTEIWRLVPISSDSPDAIRRLLSAFGA